jgi:hypothetical protein
MGGVEVDNRLGIEGTLAELIGGAEAPVDIADLVL